MALSDNLVAYWSLDEASGNAIDEHAAFDLTDVDTVTAGTGKVSGCRTFNGTSEYFTHTDDAAFSRGDTDFTWQAWVKWDSSVGVTKVVIEKGTNLGSTPEYALYVTSAGTPTFRVYPNATPVDVAWGSTLSNATWTLIHCWHDATNNQIGIAVNAGTAVTQAHSTGVRDSAEDLVIGGEEGSTGREWRTDLDEIGLWGRVLSSAERTELYNAGSGRDYAYIAGAAGDPEGRLVGGKLLGGGLLVGGVLIN